MIANGTLVIARIQLAIGRARDSSAPGPDRKAHHEGWQPGRAGAASDGAEQEEVHCHDEKSCVFKTLHRFLGLTVRPARSTPCFHKIVPK
jgi:hypothetical protein